MRVNLYLNDKDYALWQALPNRSKWVSDQLNKRSTGIHTPSKQEVSIHTDSKPDVHTPVTTDTPKRLTPVEMCKNGHLADWRGKCSDIDCKYS